MIRFPCPHCQRTLKAPEARAGTTVVCRRCQEPVVVPAGACATAEATQAEERPRQQEEPGHPAAEPPDETRRFFSRMRGWLRWAVAGVAGAAALSLLLAVLAPLLPLSEGTVATLRPTAMAVLPACLVILLVLLYGHGTSCPACGKWWAKQEGETECLGREQFDKGGVPWVRSRRQTTYACHSCRHTWSVTSTDEYRGSVRRPQPRGAGRRRRTD